MLPIVRQATEEELDSLRATDLLFEPTFPAGFT